MVLTATPGQALKMIRSNRGISQDALAAAVHIDQAVVSRLESDRAQASQQLQQKISRVLGVDRDAIWGEDYVSHVVVEQGASK